MDTVLSQSPLASGPIFQRELVGPTLVLVPHRPLGNLNEVEIASETGQLLELIQESARVNVIIDLNHGDYLGSAFLGAVMRLWKRVALGGGRLALCNVSDTVMQILRVTRLNPVWPIYASRAEALGAIEQP